MAIVEMIFPARCKDCKFLSDKVGRTKKGNIKITHFCDNGDSPHAGERRAKRDLVCDKWELF
jgi:hypothetical protein